MQIKKPLSHLLKRRDKSEYSCGATQLDALASSHAYHHMRDFDYGVPYSVAPTAPGGGSDCPRKPIRIVFHTAFSLSAIHCRERGNVTTSSS